MAEKFPITVLREEQLLILVALFICTAVKFHIIKESGIVLPIIVAAYFVSEGLYIYAAVKFLIM